PDRRRAVGRTSPESSRACGRPGRNEADRPARCHHRAVSWSTGPRIHPDAGLTCCPARAGTRPTRPSREGLMKLSGLLPLLRRDPEVADAVRHSRETVPTPLLHVSAAVGVRAPLAAAVAEHRPVVVVTATGREADEAAAALSNVLPTHDIAVFPAWETLPPERLSPRSDTVAKRLAVLRRLRHPGAEGTRTGPIRVLVMPVRALLQPVVTGLGDLEPVSARVGEERDLEQLTADLAAAAYTRVDMVERRGEFAVRGGILDVFPPTEDHPLRLEFFGDEIDEIRAFSVADQRSLETVEDLW